MHNCPLFPAPFSRTFDLQCLGFFELLFSLGMTLQCLHIYSSTRFPFVYFWVFESPNFPPSLPLFPFLIQSSHQDLSSVSIDEEYLYYGDILYYYFCLIDVVHMLRCEKLSQVFSLQLFLLIQVKQDNFSQAKLRLFLSTPWFVLVGVIVCMSVWYRT